MTIWLPTSFWPFEYRTSSVFRSPQSNPPVFLFKWFYQTLKLRKTGTHEGQMFKALLLPCFMCSKFKLQLCEVIKHLVKLFLFEGWLHLVASIDHFTLLYEIVRHQLRYMQLYNTQHAYAWLNLNESHLFTQGKTIVKTFTTL